MGSSREPSAEVFERIQLSRMVKTEEKNSCLKL